MAVTPVVGKFGGKSLSVFLIDGINQLASKIGTLTWKVEAATEPSAGLGDSSEEHTPTGMTMATVTQDGAFFVTDVDGTGYGTGTPALPVDPQSASRVGVIGPDGNAIGQSFIGLQGLHTNAREVLASRGALVKANVMHVITGKLEWGQILHAFEKRSADYLTETAESVENRTSQLQLRNNIVLSTVEVGALTTITSQQRHGLRTGDSVWITGHTSTPTINTTNAATLRTVTVLTDRTFTIPVDVTVAGGLTGSFTKAATTSGGAVYLQVNELVLGTFTGLLVTVRHSLDGVTYSDLQAFVVMTANGAQRIAIAAGTPIYGWTAASVDFTGAGSGGSAAVFVGLSRV